MRRTATVIATVVACLALAGCSDVTGAESDPATEAAGPATEPLTGLEVSGGTSAARRRPVLVLKMDNTASSAPQVGLSSADLVVEELVEGGVTRLAAFYYSRLPGDAGPVRSMRASDIGIVRPVGATMVTSGAAKVTIARLRRAGIDYVSEGGPGFYRKSSRQAPYNLFTSMKDVAAGLRRPAERPNDYLRWGSSADLPSGRRAPSFAAVFSGAHTTRWTYRRGTYENDNTYAAAGDAFAADSVLVLRVKVRDAGYRDPAGNFVPETKLTGAGRALLFHGGRVVRGTWRKSSAATALELSTAAGVLSVPAGRTWIELVPADGGDVVVE